MRIVTFTMCFVFAGAQAYAQGLPRMEISQFINNIRDQLIKTSQSDGALSLPLEVKDIEIQIEYLIEVTAEGSASFWVVSTGAGAKGAGTNVTTIRLGMPEGRKFVSAPGSFDPDVIAIADRQTAAEYDAFAKLYGGVSTLEALPASDLKDTGFQQWTSTVLDGGESYAEFKKKISEDPNFISDIIEKYEIAASKDPDSVLLNSLGPKVKELDKKREAASALERGWKRWLEETDDPMAFTLGSSAAKNWPTFQAQYIFPENMGSGVGQLASPSDASELSIQKPADE